MPLDLDKEGLEELNHKCKGKIFSHMEADRDNSKYTIHFTDGSSINVYTDGTPDIDSIDFFYRERI